MQKGTKAPQAAGRIHTDFEKGFIMAEVFKVADLIELGDETKVTKVSILFYFLIIHSFFLKKTIITSIKINLSRYYSTKRYMRCKKENIF